jgi:hypothetical protein
MKIPTTSGHDGTFDSITQQRVCLPVHLPGLIDATSFSQAKPELYLTPLCFNGGKETGMFQPVAPGCARYTEDEGDMETSYEAPTGLIPLLMAFRMDRGPPPLPNLSDLQSSQFFNRPLILPQVSGVDSCRPSLRPRWEARGRKNKHAVLRDSGLLLARDNAEDHPAPKGASIINSRLPMMPDSSTFNSAKRPALKPRRSHANAFVQY